MKSRIRLGVLTFAVTLSAGVTGPARAQVVGELDPGLRSGFGRGSAALPKPVSPPPSGWSPATELAAGAPTVTAPVAAANAAGLVAAAWSSGGAIEVRLRQGGAWSAPFTPSRPGATATAPSVSVAPTGDVVVSWVEGTNPNAELLASFFTNGSWGAPLSIAGPGLAIDGPRVRFGGTSETTLVWSQTTGGVCSIQAATGTSSAGFGAPTDISRGATGCYTWIRVSANASGEVLAVWSNHKPPRSGGFDVIASSRDAATGAWSVPATVGGRTYRSGSPNAALSDAGTAVVVWADAYGPLYSRRAVDGSWSPATPIDPGTWGLSYTGSNDVAVDAQGNALAVLGAFDTSFINTPLYATRIAATSYAWSLPALITDGAAAIASFEVAATAAGSFVVGWNDTNYDLLGNPIGTGVSTLVAGAGAWEQLSFGAGDESVSVAAAPGTGVVLWNTFFGLPSNVSVSTRDLK